MATFSVLATRGSGLYSCELDVQPADSAVLPGEIMEVTDRGSPFEYLILAVLPHKGKPTVTLVCLNWLLPDNQLVGMTLESKPMKSKQKSRYSKYIAPQ
jgi:hypothetical protein